MRLCVTDPSRLDLATFTVAALKCQKAEVTLL